MGHGGRARGWIALLVVVAANIAAVQVATVDRADASHSFTAHFGESFDAVTPPALPTGWTAVCATCQTGDTTWHTASGAIVDPPNMARVQTTGHVTDKVLESRPFTYPRGARFDFNHQHFFDHDGFSETGRDGGVIEMKVGTGAWQDILAAGGFSTGDHYNGRISGQNNPLNGRQAFIGFQTWKGIDFFLPDSGAGQTVQLRFRVASDRNGVGADGYWLIDRVRVYTTSRHPSIAQAAGQPDPAFTAPINFTATFDDVVTGFTGADISFAGSTAPGTLTAVVTGGPTTYNVAVSGMTGPGNVVASIPADVTDQGNAASTSTDNSVNYAAPTMNQAAAQADPTNTSPINFTATFPMSVTGFTGTDVSFAGSTAPGTLSAVVSGGPTTYNVAVSGMTGPGIVKASIPPNVVSPGNLASTSTDNSVTYDPVRPTVTINQASGQGDPTGISPVNFTATFSEPVSGFVGSDISFTGSTASGLAAVVSGGPSTYNVAVSVTGPGAVVASIPAGVAADPAGNTNTASTSTDNLVQFTVPTVTINQAEDQTDPTEDASIDFIAVFSQAVTGFTAADISFTGSTAPGTLSATVTGGPSSYTVKVSGMTGTSLVKVSIPANVVNEGNAASTSTDNTVLYDNDGPTVTLSEAAGQNDPTSVSPINYTAVFSEPVTVNDPAFISFQGSSAPGALAAAITGGPTTFNLAVSGMTGSGQVVVQIHSGFAYDAAGNINDDSNSVGVQFNAPAPASVTINQAAGQADPTNASPINFTAVFSRGVSGFTGADISFVQSTAPGSLSAVVTGGPSTYNVAVSGMTGPGLVRVSIPSSVVDGGNSASTSTDRTVAYDNVVPTVTINQSGVQADPTSLSPITFTAIFSENVTGFAPDDVTVTGTAGGTKTVEISGEGPIFSVHISGMTTAGTVMATIPANVAFDVAGNGNTASTSTDNQVTWVLNADLSVDVTDGADAVKAGGTATYTITVVNGGPSGVAGVTVTDTLPAKILSATWTCAGTLGGMCTAAGSGSISDSVNLPARASVTYTVTAQVSPAAVGTLSNTASAALPAGTTDPTPANNTFTDNDTITPQQALPGVVTGSTGWNLNTGYDATSEHTFSLGVRPLVPVMGDWDGDGVKTPGYFKNGVFHLFATVAPAEPAPTQITFGDPTGFPLAGDFDGDGRDDLAVFRAGTWQIRYTATGATPTPFTFGSGTWPATVPVVGDWNSDGIDGIGVYARTAGADPAGTWRLRNSATAGGTTDIDPFVFNPGASPYPVVGDWNLDGRDTVGVKAGSSWCLKDTNTAGNACSQSFTYGLANDLPVIWRND